MTRGRNALMLRSVAHLRYRPRMTTKIDTETKFERPLVVVCQCIPVCHFPVDDGAGSYYGCTQPAEPEHEHSLEGPDGFTYREPPAFLGPRVVLRNVGEDGVSLWGECFRCKTRYTATVSVERSDDAPVFAAPNGMEVRA